MHVYLDCIPCFFNQGLFAARQVGCSPACQKKLMDAISARVPDISLDRSPPEIAVDIYSIIRDILQVDDPFESVKKASNEAALAVYPELVQRIRDSSDPLLTAVLVAISGNIIDYGANVHIDLAKEISHILTKEAKKMTQEDTRLFNLEHLRASLGSSHELLYIGDNAGEIVFDRVFIETLLQLYPDLRIRYAVRGRPIINDVTLKDAEAVGLDRVCEVVSSGSPAPGAVPALCTEEFQKLLEQSDIIISKGQGNYEALSDSTYPVFYLLRVKCPVIAADIPAEKGSICLLRKYLGK